MPDYLTFCTRLEFREWLSANGGSNAGVWLLFGKPGGPETLSGQEALEEALCFGWIDGQIRRIDERTYRKYFAPRRDDSPWSPRNRVLAKSLEAGGRMTEAGRRCMDCAMADGRWDAPAPERAADKEVEGLMELLRGNEPAYGNFCRMAPSVQRTYAMFYLSAKQEATRAARLVRILDRLHRNLPPM
jgi:uncharacterized protein YdeI (YjbR/CyaY-like superfamily)